MPDVYLNIPHEMDNESKYEKQCHCMMHGKRCAECDGADVFGEKCRWYLVRRDGDKNGNGKI